MKPQNIILDLGGVIANLDIHTTLERLSDIGIKAPDSFSGCSDPVTAIFRMGPVGELIQQMDEGKISGHHFAEKLHQYFKPQATVEEIMGIYRRMLVIPRDRIEWISRLSQKYHVLLLSNIGDLHWQYFSEVCWGYECPVTHLFEHRFLSYQLKVAKPNPKIFEHLISDSGIDPAVSLYLDDSETNLSVGRQFGLQTMLVPTNDIESTEFYRNHI